MILETTFATDFTPGTNVKGEVVGANWSFLLPSLELTRVLCMGMPSAGTLLALARFSQEVIVCGDRQWTEELGKFQRRYGLDNILSMPGSSSQVAIADGNIDLVLIAERSEARRLSRDQSFCLEIERVLSDEGVIYFETDAAVERVLEGEMMPGLAGRFGAPRIFWVTPITGEMQTAVPVGQATAIAYTIENRIYRRSLDMRIFKHAVQSINFKKLIGTLGNSRNGQPKPAQAERPQYTLASEHSAQGRPKRRRVVRDVSVLAFNRVQAELGNLERFLRMRGMFNRVFQRYSILLGGQASDRGSGPPRYLREIAARSGVDIRRHHWGLYARGEYSSRKVLLLLFREAQATPEFIVKITRDSALNPRLENEYRALVTLEQQGIGDRDSLPRVAFYGQHAGLAMLGETIVDGIPFEQRSDETADCTYMQATIDWLTRLGEATADRNAASPAQVAETMQRLLSRFAQIYRLSTEHYEFLRQQTDALAQADDQFPLVFQHGDPGTWNILITQTGNVAFLDWEAAEAQGMPLWDLFYFMYTYGVWAARTATASDRMKGFEQQFLADSPISAALVKATARYCAAVGLNEQLIEPLFYTCWMHRALKEATRLTEKQLNQGHYLNMLRASIDRRAALAPLFSLVSAEK